LLALDYLSHPPTKPRKYAVVYISILLGLISFINLSGVFIAGIVSLMYLFSIKKSVFHKIRLSIIMIVLITFFSGFELPYFFRWSISGGTKKMNIIAPIQVFTQDIFSKFSVSRLSGKSLMTSTPAQYKANEFNSYQIHGLFDIYVRGKFQGFFQFEYFGIIFDLFAIVLFFRWRSIINNRLNRLLLIFLGLYYLIFIDIFGINPFQYSYVLTVSHKYTAMIVPLVAIITASQFDWIKRQLKKIKIKYLIGTAILIFPVVTIFSPISSKIVMSLVSKIVPILNSPKYYLDLVLASFRLFSYLIFGFLILYLILRFKYRERLLLVWSKFNLNALIIVFFVIIVPGLFFFDTNLGLKQTTTLSFAPDEVKMANIKGWENIYLMVNQLNGLPPDSDILFLHISPQLIAIHLKFPSKQMHPLNNWPGHQINQTDMIEAIKLNDINYILTSPEPSFILPGEIIFSTKKMILYSL